MTFGKLLEHKMRKIFLEKSYTKRKGETSPRKVKYLWINSLKCYKVCFYCMSRSRSTKIYQNVGANHLLLHKAFIKNKKRSGTSLPAHVLDNFYGKYFSRYVLLTLYFINRFST